MEAVSNFLLPIVAKINAYLSDYILIFLLVGIGLFFLLRPLGIDEKFIICTVCTLAMPLGLNTIVVPSAYGKDTSVAAGMALVSHILSIISIPLIFMLLNVLI